MQHERDGDGQNRRHDRESSKTGMRRVAVAACGKHIEATLLVLKPRRVSRIVALMRVGIA